MGMYTGLKMCFSLKSDTPAEIIDILKIMVGETAVNTNVIAATHPLFQTTRWPIMLRCQSAIFPECNTGSFSVRLSEPADWSYGLNTTSSFKNYDDELEKFLNWIAPYADVDAQGYAGEYRYEENANWTSFSFVNGQVVHEEE